ncbi:pollen receptor-like kinase 4 [Impatiens glandulifera]|uniref:pollen receptor-like kinase 4 n=1 Tax=Impatiens glandulifera TaxID=253017 RepID=UPI001FB14B4A|nr:pollen receptor-like kinase 4 [Impatiens glandulifera]
MGLSGKVDIDTLLGLPRLRTIRLDNNSLDGPLPEFGRLGSLKSLFVNRNKFSGQIPDNAFVGMGSMKKLVLSHNSFVGPVPTSVIQLPKLTELRIEGNQFTGRIPNLQQKSLTLVNVSYNHLEGPIPPSIASMHVSCFTGNNDLCGKPLELVCGATPKWKIALIVFICLLALGFLLLIIAVLHQKKKDRTPTLGKVDSSSYSSKKSGRASSTVAVVGTGGNSYGDSGSVSGGMSRGGSGRGGSANSRKAEQAGKLSFLKDDRTRFDLQDLLRASAEVLGSGNFGSSYKALLMDGQAVVVKRFKQMTAISREEFHEHMRRIGRLQHPNLLPLVAYYYRKEEKLLVFDYFQNGSVARHLYGNHNEEQPGLNWPTRLKIVKGMAKGLAYLHAELPSLSVAHGHLKSSNVLLNDSFEPMLMDYALVPAVNPDQAPHLLVAYKSPEYAEHGRITKQTDVWSLGILILEILTGKFPANNMTQGKSGNHHAELTNWVSSIKRQSENSTAKLFDPDMKATAEEEKEMMKLLIIGANCCETDAGKRSELKDVILKIEEIKDRGR